MKPWAWSAIALIALLVWGLEQVIVTPVETGEMYPAYSSLRADPLGAKALYDSLAQVIPSERLYKDRTKLEDPGDALLVLGVDPVAWSALPAESIREYQTLVENGGRLILGFLPVRTPANEPLARPVEALWGVKLKYRAMKNGGDSGSIPRETALYFEPSKDWTTHAGFIERKFGRGTIVLAADTFPLSNEGLREDRDAAGIAALVGPARRVIFDENHFGVIETGSVVELMRKYGLEGGIAVLAIVAALFLWRSSSSLLPPRKTSGAAAVAGRDSLSGMTALLYRGVAGRDLMNVCFAEWNRTERNPERASRVEDAIRGRDPVAAYHAACGVVSERKR